VTDRLDRGEKKALADIDQYGCHIIHVLGEDEHPPFSYSVGIQRSAGRPEVVVIGLEDELAQFIINEYNARVQRGEEFKPGQSYSEFIDRFEVAVEKVDQEFYAEHFGWNLWLYDGPDFHVLQIIYPTTEGVWPWEVDASDSFRTWQRVLTTTPAFPRGQN